MGSSSLNAEVNALERLQIVRGREIFGFPKKFARFSLSDQLTAMTLQNIVVNRIVEGNATVDFGKSPADPLYLLQPLEVLQGIYCEVDFDLPYGEVVHEYQAKKLPSEVYAAAS
jgi:acetoacetate decarboxylase